MKDDRHNDNIIIEKLEGLEKFLSLEVAYLKKSVSELEKRNEAYSARISVIEMWQSNSMGRVATIFSIVGLIAGAFITWLFRQF